MQLAAVRSVLFLSLVTVACTPMVGTISDDDDGSADTGPDANCASVDFTASQTIPSIHLLIDRSGSMGTYLPNTSTTRYQAMRDALVGTTGVVGQLEAKVSFAASLYSSDDPCPKLYNTSTRKLNNFIAIQALIDSQGPSGDTPTPAAIDQTVAYFAANPVAMGSPPIIVLATDGLPNSCFGGDTQTESIQAAANAYAKGIRTFVLGIAGVNDTFLQSLANAGQGVPPVPPAGQSSAKFYTANSPQDLKTAFEQIINGVVSCELAINGTVDPEAAKGGVVTLNGMTLTYGSDWVIVNGTTIRLLGQACESLKAGSTVGGTVKASFPCGAVLL